jgi:hypothetical protein
VLNEAGQWHIQDKVLFAAFENVMVVSVLGFEFFALNGETLCNLHKHPIQLFLNHGFHFSF